MQQLETHDSRQVSANHDVLVDADGSLLVVGSEKELASVQHFLLCSELMP